MYYNLQRYKPRTLIIQSKRSSTLRPSGRKSGRKSSPPAACLAGSQNRDFGAQLCVRCEPGANL